MISTQHENPIIFVHCDKCGDGYKVKDDDMEISHFTNFASAFEFMTDDDWKFENGKVICPKCK